MKFDKNFFIKQIFEKTEVLKLRKSVERDLGLAQGNAESEIIFHFAYMALIKIGIYLLARENYRVKSRPGHHQKIIEVLGEILADKDVLVVGDQMRKERNLDFYSAGSIFSKEEAKRYLHFVEGVYKKAIAA